MIQIIHISDFHLESKELSMDKQNIISALINDLNLKITDKENAIIVISGDLLDKGGIGFSTIEEGFRTFESHFIERISSELNIDKNHFFFVPGNHDVYREGINKYEETGIKSNLNTQEEISKFIKANKKDEKNIDRIKKYKEFESKYYDNFKDKKLSPFDSNFLLTDLKVGISCLNSSWRCFGDSDKGNLIIGKEQIDSACNYLKNANVKIAIAHHPFEYLLDVDKNSIRPIISANFDILLVGHAHCNDMTFTKDFYGTILICQSNATIADSSKEKDYQNGYSIINFQKEKCATISYRKYLPEHKKFVANTDVGNDDGKITLTYPHLDKITQDKGNNTPQKKRSEEDVNECLEVHGADAKNKSLIFFSQKKRPPEMQIIEAIKDAKKFYFMAKTGADFFSNYFPHIKNAIDSGCRCKFIIVNQHSLAIEYGRCEANNLDNIESAYFYLRDFISYGKDKVEIRVLNYYPNFDFEYFEKNGKKTIIVRNNFLFSHLGIDRPLFMLQEKDHWFSIFFKEFELAWEKAQVWGETKRIIIDGAPGSGKTTLLTGKSQRDESKKKFECIKDSGYTIFEELIYGVAAYMRKEGHGELYENWDMFFNLVIDRAINFYKEAKPDLISFYDRGIYFLEIMAERYDYKLPDKYYDFIKKYKYDDPIFILHPILDIDMRIPHQIDHKYKVYSQKDRMEQHKKIIELYKKNGYNVIEIPLLHDTMKVNTELRLLEINKILEI